MVTSKEIATLPEVVGFLRSLASESAELEAEAMASIAVCDRVLKERAELLKAVERLSRRLTLCTTELARAARGLK